MSVWHIGCVLLLVAVCWCSLSYPGGFTVFYVTFNITIFILMERRFSLMSSPDKALNSASPFLHRNASKLSLGFFNRGKGDNWHRLISTTAVDFYLFGEHYEINAGFPWTILQQHTDALLRKKGVLTPQQQDECLVALIRKHDAKDIAVAACGHAMSVQALRQLLLTDFNVNTKTEDTIALKNFYQILLIANHVNSGGFSPWEVQCARLLLSASGTTPIHYLAASVQALLAGVPMENMLYLHVLELARKALVIFTADLKRLEQNSKWTLARSAVRWLSMFTAAAANIPNEVLNLLHEIFPSWRAWAMWRPDPERIVKWELFTEEQRMALGKLLALEGPDLLRSTYGSLRESESRQGLQRPSHIPRFSSLIELRGVPVNEIDNLVDRVLKIVDTVCTNCPYNTPFLVYFCIGKIISPQPLELLECLNSLADTSISVTVAQIFKIRNEPEDARVTAALQLLPFLNAARCHELRGICQPHIAMIINGELNRRKKALESQLQPRRRMTGHLPWTGAEMKLQSLVAQLMHLEWLWPLITYDGLSELLGDWPSVDDLKNLHSIRIAAQTSAAGPRDRLLPMIDGYYLDSLVTRGTINDETRALVKSLISLWRRTSDWNRRGLALLVAEGQGLITSNRCQFIDQLADLNIGFVTRFHSIMTTYNESGDAACIDLAALLANSQAPDLVNCWRPALYSMVVDRGSKLLDYTLNKFKVDEWIRWLRNLRIALGGQLFLYEGNSPSVLSEDLHKWAQRLNSHLAMITVLEQDITLGSARKCLMFGGDQKLQQILEQILSILSFDMKAHNQPAMYAVVPYLATKGENANEVLDILNALTRTTEEGVDACLQLMEFHRNNAPEVAEVLQAGLLQSSSLNKFDEKAVECMATLLGVPAGIRSGWSEDSLKVVADYLDAQYALIVAKAQELDAMRVALKVADPEGTSRLLAEINVEDISQVETALSELPPELMSVVEKVGEREVEMLFPLTHLTQLQRAAIGADNAQSLLLRLMVGGDGMPPGFCIHLDTESNGRHSDTSYFSAHKEAVGIHSPWMVFEEDGHPDVAVCHGKIIPAKYQLTRLLHRHLVDGFKSLEAIHVLVTNALKGMGRLCITCGTPNGANLRRATVCQARWCAAAYKKANLDIRLSDIRSDPLAVDLLLTMVYAAARSNNLALLPGCPFNSTAVVIQILNSLPAMATLQKARYLDSTISALGGQAEQLLTWVCTSYRGFLATATGALKIPSMPPGTHQFVLANASPEKESAFQAHVARDPNTRLLFHGTSPDRIFAILCQGLQIKSGTTLQANGAASGAGIYMAEEPATSWAYTNRNPLQGNWAKSQLGGFRVLLGCENAGPSVGNASMHVLRDESTVMVRYLFLIPSGVGNVPVRRHLDTALMSAFRGLRSGAL